MIAAHPSDPTNYIDLAYTLVDAGIGDQAYIAAAEATRAAPTAAFAFNAQGWVLHHNSIGVDYGKGFDYQGALRAFRRSIELDPNNLDVRESLAELLEHDTDGIHYAPSAQLSLAIEARRYVKQHQSPVQEDTEDNLAFLLFYAGRYDEALAELEHFPASPKREGIVLASIAATKNSSAAIQLSTQIGGDEQKRKDALTLAAEGLWNMRMYAQAADLLTASLPNASDGTSISAKIQLFSTLKPYKANDLPASDPRRPVQQLVVAAFTDTLSESVLAGVLSRHSYATEKAWQNALRLRNVLSGVLENLMKQTGLPRIVLADLVLSRVTFAVTANDGFGASIVVKGIGPTLHHFFVLPEDGSYRVAASGQDAAEVGNQVLYLLANKQTEKAASILKWRRALFNDRVDDPLGGQLSARLWTPSDRQQQNMFVSAASLVVDPTTLRSILPEIVDIREKAVPEVLRTNLDLLLASLYLRLLDAPNALIVTGRLLKQFPNSMVAIRFAGRANGINQNWSAWKALLAPRLREHPQDRDLLLESISEAVAEANYGYARKMYRVILDGEHASADDNNTYAWLSLFESVVDDGALAAAQQASLSAGNQNYAYLHTLACLNAARGNTAEAHQELLEAMSIGHLNEPNRAIWYGFGRIYEQYGVTDAAVTAYRRVVALEDLGLEAGSPNHNEASTYVLAQAGLKRLHAN